MTFRVFHCLPLIISDLVGDINSPPSILSRLHASTMPYSNEPEQLYSHGNSHVGQSIGIGPVLICTNTAMVNSSQVLTGGAMDDL